MGSRGAVFEAYQWRLQNFPPNRHHPRHPPRHLWSLLCWKWYPLQGGLKDRYSDIFCKSPKLLCGFSLWIFSKSSQVISFIELLSKGALKIPKISHSDFPDALGVDCRDINQFHPYVTCWENRILWKLSADRVYFCSYTRSIKGEWSPEYFSSYVFMTF